MAEDNVILHVDNLVKHFPITRGIIIQEADRCGSCSGRHFL